ncbi:MAG: FMN-binding protein [Spirochaetales bacterium]
MKKIFALVLLAVCASLPLAANTYLELKDALKLLLPTGQKYFKQDIELTDAQAKVLNTKWDNGGYQAGDPFTMYYTKDASGKVTGVAVVMTEFILRFSSSHTWMIGVKPDLSLSGVAMLEITNEHAYGLSSKAFQAQFTAKNPTTTKLGAGIDAVTGATDSCQLVIDSTQKVLYLISQFPPQ